MLGWEFPPRISGGLGTACQGIVEGLAANGVDVRLVVPRLSGGEHAAGAELLAAGDVPVLAEADADSATELNARLQLEYIESPLRPYQSRQGYGALLQRLRRPTHRSTGAEPHPAARARAFQGGYGPHLASEVERYAHAVAQLARRGDFDVIHAHDWMTVPAGLLARQVSGRPLVYHVHSCEWDRSGEHADAGICRIEQLALESAEVVVCVSHFTRRLLQARYRTDPARLWVVHNAVRRGEARARRRLPADGPPTVLFLGRLTRQKGPDFFLEAVQQVARVRPDAHFVIGGDGDLRPELMARVRQLGLQQRVHFPGFLGPVEVEEAFAAADLYVMPSASEPFGIAPLEALAYDTPVIVSRQSGVAEALPSSPKVDYGDVPDLAAKILELLESPALRERLVRAGQRELERLRWERAAQRLLKLYHEALAACGVGA